MTTFINFFRAKAIATLHVQALGRCEASETFAGTGTTTRAAETENEIAVIFSDTNTIRVAKGTAPNTALTAYAAASSAGFAIPVGVPLTVALEKGDKIAVENI